MEKPTKPTPPESPTATGEFRLDQIKKQARSAANVIVPALASAVLAYFTAGVDSKTKAGEAKDKAESGYQSMITVVQALDKNTKALQEELVQQKTALAELKRRLLRTSSKRRSEAPRPAPPLPEVVKLPVASPAASLPKDLDKAFEQQQQKAATPQPLPPQPVTEPLPPPAK